MPGRSVVQVRGATGELTGGMRAIGKKEVSQDQTICDSDSCCHGTQFLDDRFCRGAEGCNGKPADNDV